MIEGQMITFHGEADQEFNKDSGDVIMVIIEKDHERFKRKGADLITKVDIRFEKLNNC